MEELVAGYSSASEDYNVKSLNKESVSHSSVSGQPMKAAMSSQYIPLRLTAAERSILTVVENALEVSEYTDSVDVTYSHTSKNKHSRIIEGLIDVLSISSGLLVRTYAYLPS